MPGTVTNTHFDIRARVIECGHCGAPLSGAAGQTVQCQYCGSPNQLVARPDDGRSAPTVTDEVVRLSQLKAQEANPVAGHAYDLSDVPLCLKAMGASEATGSDLDALQALWPRMKEVAPRSVEEQRGLVWVAIQCARLLSDRELPAEARAKLETTLHLLPDPGHRQLVRTELALEAIGAGELEAAEAWLRECDAASNVLELDSAYRYAQARLCIVRGDVPTAYALTGAEPGAIPWSRTHLLRAALLRITLRELAGDKVGAERLWGLAASKHGAERVLQTACDDKVAPQTRRARAMQQATYVRAGIATASNSWGSLLLGTLWRIPLVAFVLAFLTMVEGCTTKIGPVAGTTSHFICPWLCDGCQPPITYLQAAPDAAVLCDSLDHPASQMDWSGRSLYYRDFPQQAVPGGAFTMAALSFLMLSPLAVPIAFAFALRRRGKLRRDEAILRRQLERLAREVGGPEAVDLPFARWRSKAWLLAAGFVAATLAFSAVWLGIARLAVSDPPEEKTRAAALGSWTDTSELGLHGRELDAY